MPQTEEAVNHARAAGVPIVVALNKIDKPDANGMRAKQQLSALGLTPEEWGGDTVVVETSAIQGKGISELLEMLTLVADLQDLKADPTMPARGTVLEAQVHEGRGVIATGLIRAGTLRIGDSILVGQTSGRVKALYDDTGRPLNEAGPSMPVLISGLSGMPSAGARLIVMEGDTSARQIAEERALRGRVTTVREHVTLENLFSRLEEGEIAELPLILKADGQGSLLALQEQLENLSTPEVRVRILHAAVGGINKSDVLLAHASDAITVGFHVVPSDKARILAREKAVDIRLFNVIYKVLDDIRSALEGTLEPEEVEEVKGHLEVRQVFRISRTGNIAGCYVKDGIIERADILRLIRDDMVIYEGGRIDSLRRHKDDVREVKEGFECGVKIQGYEDVKVGDIIEAYVINLVPRKLSTVDNG
jgi:translation initiation factor IF-2